MSFRDLVLLAVGAFVGAYAVADAVFVRDILREAKR